MSKVITFSRTFPAYHPKAGQPTHFVEKIATSLYSLFPTGIDERFYNALGRIAGNDWLKEDLRSYTQIDHQPKHHTIRAGHRFKVGDKFSPRVWSGKPYRSKQIIIAPDIEVKKVWNFEIYNDAIYIEWRTCDDYEAIAKNDGLSLNDFLAWFKYPKPFDGQIICWNENINY